MQAEYRSITYARPLARRAMITRRPVVNVTALTKEIEGRARIKSKHVGELYECLQAGKLPAALVMEYVPGESLADPASHPATMGGTAAAVPDCLWSPRCSQSSSDSSGHYLDHAARRGGISGRISPTMTVNKLYKSIG
jgi:hypothetical protein